MDLTAEQVPALRRELVEYGRTDEAAFMATLMINSGRQPIRPPGHPAKVGRLIAETEADRLARADLWFVDGDLADLIDSAFPTMPSFAPRPFDLPGPHGFVVFARPLTAMIRPPIPGDKALAEALAATDPSGNDALNQAMIALTGPDVGIVAASWGPVEESALAGHARPWPAGGVWFSFYSMPMSVKDPSILQTLAAATGDPYRRTGPTLTVDNELVAAWQPEGSDPERWLLPLDTGGTAAWGAAVLTAFLLARQGNVSEQVEQRVARPERRRYKAAGLAEPGPVRVMRLRRSVNERAPRGEGKSGREYRHRWIVRAHWRNVWYSTLQVHRPRLIAPYLAGPEGAPLLGGERVTRLSAPSDSTTPTSPST